MSGWELFTWLNAWVLGVGSVLVFLWFLRDVPGMLRRLGWIKPKPQDGSNSNGMPPREP